MTVGYYSPLPPARTGVAAYSAALLPVLRRFGAVQPNAARADVYLYHLGNNQLHREIYFRALRRPGLVVLHDAVLHHFLLGCLDRAAYVEEFVYNYGEWSRGLAEELWRSRARSAQDPRYFRYPMLKRVAEASLAVIVHNPAAARMVTEHCPAARVIELPFPCYAPSPPAAWELLRLRQAFGLTPRTFLFGVFGYLRESKRLTAVLRAFQSVRRAGVEAAILVAGQYASADLERAAAPLLRGVLRVGHTPEAEFWRLAALSDACVNLRFPAAGETSAIAVPLMAMGKPVLVSDTEENARWPEGACLKVVPGLAEGPLLACYMTWLASFPEAAREIGRRAAAHIAGHHSLESVARKYWEALCDCR